MKELTPFHLAIPVKELEVARNFYGNTLNCNEGRSSDKWVDFDFYGHQLVIHEVSYSHTASNSNPVDGHNVPVPHFGVILKWTDFHDLADRVRKAGVSFIIEPYIRFEGEPGEQATMFFNDPSGNALEFKSFKDLNQIFAK